MKNPYLRKILRSMDLKDERMDTLNIDSLGSVHVTMEKEKQSDGQTVILYSI